MRIPEHVASLEGPKYGWVVAARGKLLRPSKSRNPGEFNPRQYYEAAGISLLMTCRGPQSLTVLDSSGGLWLMNSLVAPAREHVLSVIDSTIGGEEGEFLKGLLLGEKQGLTIEVREAFTSAGVAHILAVSGSNVAFIAAMVFFPLELLRIPRKVRTLAACAGVALYMLLVGNQASVVRATVMSLVFLTGGLLEEKSNPVNSLGVAGLILLSIRTQSLFDIGFQLSFVAVLSIILLYPKMDSIINLIPGQRAHARLLRIILKVCAVSFSATLGTLPLTAGYFGQVSVVGLLVNTIVVPASGLCLILGFVSVLASMVSAWLAAVYAEFNHIILALVLKLTLITGNLPFASVETMSFSAADALPYYAGLALLFHITARQLASRLFVLFLVTLNGWLLLDEWNPENRAAAKLRVTFVDVGQGDAALLEFPDGKTMLIDAGPRSARVDAGERTIVPLLERKGISTIDLLVVTHPHGDHLGGVPALLKHLEVDEVIDCGFPARSRLFAEYVEGINNERCNHTSVRSGRLLTVFSGARLYVLSPPPEFFAPGDSLVEDLNNASVVLRLQFGEVSFLFAGDAEAEAEHAMVARYGDFLKATVLKAGHHGSITSSTTRFLSQVDPEYVIVSVGLLNRYGHPSRLVMERLQDLGAEVLRTDEEGAIVFETDGTLVEKR
jgi:competence protein ComEC